MVRLQLRQNTEQVNLQGQGQMGEITYIWNGALLDEGKAPERFNVQTGELEEGKDIIRLWQVTIELRLKTAKRSYQYNEVTW